MEQRQRIVEAKLKPNFTQRWVMDPAPPCSDAGNCRWVNLIKCRWRLVARPSRDWLQQICLLWKHAGCGKDRAGRTLSISLHWHWFQTWCILLRNFLLRRVPDVESISCCRTFREMRPFSNVIFTRTPPLFPTLPMLDWHNKMQIYFAIPWKSTTSLVRLKILFH